MEAKVIIRGKTFLYRQKAPFEPSGFSIGGAVEFNEDADLVRCHECGNWFKSIGRHLGGAHEMTAREYKRKHRLGNKAALDCEGLRAKLIQQGQNAMAVRGGLRDPEVRARALMNAVAAIHARKGIPNGPQSLEVKNEDGRCHAQLLSKLRCVLDRVGHTPSIAELADDGISATSLLVAFNVKHIGDVMSLLGLRPNEYGGPAATRGGKRLGREATYTKVLCIELVRDFWVKHSRLPSQSDYRRGLLPTYTTIRKMFGSMEVFYQEAGLREEFDRRRMEIATAAAALGAEARKTVSAEVKTQWAKAGWESRRNRGAVS